MLKTMQFLPLATRTMSALEKLDFTSAHVIQRAAFVTRTHRVSDGFARACFWQYCSNRLVVMMRTGDNMSSTEARVNTSKAVALSNRFPIRNPRRQDARQTSFDFFMPPSRWLIYRLAIYQRHGETGFGPPRSRRRAPRSVRGRLHPALHFLKANR